MNKVGYMDDIMSFNSVKNKIFRDIIYYVIPVNNFFQYLLNKSIFSHD